jgi:predicted nuclease of predicted toxin-antitoxin system
MIFLLDQGLPRSTVRALADRGIVAEHVGQIGMATASDAEILEAARTRDEVVVTLDADFHSLLAAAHATNPSVIRIRIEGLKGEDIAQTIERVVGSGQTELGKGAAVSVTTGGIRIRLLPLV